VGPCFGKHVIGDVVALDAERVLDDLGGVVAVVASNGLLNKVGHEIRLTQLVWYSTPSILNTICSGVETSATSSFPSAARRSIPASWRQLNLVRYSAGRCFSTSARTSWSVASSLRG